MLDRIILCVCHPSKIVYFFKDKIYKPLLFVLSFFLLYIGICALSNFSTTVFHSGYSDDAVSTISRNLDSVILSNVSYNTESHEFSGNEAIFTGNNFEIVFMPGENVKVSNSDLILLVFDKASAKSYYKGVQLGEYSYTSLVNGLSFTISDVVAGNTIACDSFRMMSQALLVASETGISGVLTLDYVLTGFIYWVGLLIFILVMSFFNNPNLGFNVRIKLCLYDTIIYFVIMCFYIGFSFEWLLYLALIAACFYSNITFSHIVKK